MKKVLKVSNHLIKEVIRDSLIENHEVCGFLLGVEDDKGLKVVELYKVKNVSPMSQVRFEMDPKSIYEAHRYAEEIGLEIVGIYHSHPGPPIPSSTDLEYMKNWPVAWLIISSNDGSVAAYVMENERVRRLEILLE